MESCTPPAIYDRTSLLEIRAAEETKNYYQKRREVSCALFPTTKEAQQLLSKKQTIGDSTDTVVHFVGDVI